MSDETKKCPYCAETIKAEAIVCRYCGHDLNAPFSPHSTVSSTSANKAKATETEETTVLEAGDVKITNLRAIIGEKTYAMSNVSSVSKIQKPAKSYAGLAAIGSLIFLAGFINTREYVGCILVGLVIAIGALVVQNSAKPTYAVKIGSTSGESNILESQDEEHVQKIVAAMNEAIVKKG